MRTKHLRLRAAVYDRLLELARPRQEGVRSPVLKEARLTEWVRMAGVVSSPEDLESVTIHDAIAPIFPEGMSTAPLLAVEVGIEAMRELVAGGIAEPWRGGFRAIGG